MQLRKLSSLWIVSLWIVFVTLAIHGEETGWQADPKLQEELQKKKVTWLYREQDVRPYQLPDALVCTDGTRITAADGWEKKRRPELLDLFRKNEYGYPPTGRLKMTFEVLETDAKAIDGLATRKRIRITSTDGDGKAFSFEASLLVPNGIKHAVPAFVLINNRAVTSADPTRQQKDGFWPVEEILARGYATAVFRTVDVDADSRGEAAHASGVRGVWPAGGGKVGEDAWATIGAWAWGASRVLDYLQTDPAIDGEKVAVVGHSRGGKTALWAGAQDPRFAIAISNDSGRGGASLSRRRFGESVETINRSFPYWFCENFHRFGGHEDELPIDQHELIALMAPRAVYVASADGDFWADQRGEFLSLVNAAGVFALYGQPGFKADEMPPLQKQAIRGRVGYHIRTGPHNLTPYDWEQYMHFADELWGKAK